jgi:hypothetical protein
MWVIVSFVLFGVLTMVAMLYYPGGTITDATTLGYSFFNNFFSDLGLTETYAGQPNTLSAVLFVAALTMAGCGLAVFFIAFRQFFLASAAESWLSGIGSCCGVIAGICFVGVALTPANLYLDMHLEFVFWAFRAFPLAVLCYAIAIFRDCRYPKRFALVFVAFGILLVLYLLLIEQGPDIRTPTGMIIQATGQKIIVYATIITVLIQAFGAKQVARERNSGTNSG